MPRRARMYLSGLPYHIVQHGNNREACFVESENYQYYLELWKECGARYGVAVHAYCLMTNHIHFWLRLRAVTQYPPLLALLEVVMLIALIKHINARGCFGRVGINQVWFKLTDIF